MKSFSGSGTLTMDAAAGYFSKSDIANEMTTEMKYREEDNHFNSKHTHRDEY